MTPLEEVYRLFLASSGVQTDSRNVAPNQLFFALKGPKFDGNQYAADAVKKGAHACIVDDPIIAQKNTKYFLVDDALQSLQKLANYHRNQFNIPVIALTGSNGKTTTKELTNAVLASTHHVMATEGNLNNHIGVPLTLLKLQDKHTHAIIEMGANHLKEINFLCSIAQPTHGLITNVGKAHLEGFGSEEGVLQGKTELYRYLEKTNGLVFVDKENTKLISALGKNQCVTYNSTSVEIVEEEPTLTVYMEQLTVKTKLTGSYNISNIAAAYCVGMHFGVAPKDAASAITNYAPNNSRSQLLKQNGKTLTFDAYNANPTSMQAAITAFGKRRGKKTVILGHMAELGSFEQAEHKSLVKLVGTLDFDACYWVGQPYKSLVEGNWFSSVTELADFLKNNPIDATEILIKGSRSATLEKVVEFL